MKPMQAKQKTEVSEFEERVIQLKRVSKKTKGGNTISFAALVIIGNKKGLVGTGYDKGRDVSSAITKAVAKAKRDMVKVNMIGDTIAHEVRAKYIAAKILLKPAPKGAGIIAGGAVRVVCELAGIKDISAKSLGANNKICNIRCTLKALRSLKSAKAKV